MGHARADQRPAWADEFEAAMLQAIEEAGPGGISLADLVERFGHMIPDEDAALAYFADELGEGRDE